MIFPKWVGALTVIMTTAGVALWWVVIIYKGEPFGIEQITIGSAAIAAALVAANSHSLAGTGGKPPDPPPPPPEP